MTIFIKHRIYRPLYVAIRILILCFFLLHLYSCEKALEPEYPDFLLSDEAVYENEATVHAALANVYSGLRDISPVTGGVGGVTVLFGLYTDELNFYRENAQSEYAFFNHTVLSNNTAVADFWNSSYALIYQINSITEGLTKSSLEPTIKEKYLGEAYFIRAFLHNYLTHLFGEIPYIESTQLTENATANRMSIPTIYKKIETDLKMAIKLLPTTEVSGERLRASKGVARALLARLYLIKQNYDLAFAESNDLINSGVYTWQPSLSQVFLKESTSTIWQLKPEFEGSGTKEAEVFVSEFGPPTSYALTNNFINDFEPTDFRRDIWTREITDGTTSWFHPYKYKQNLFEGISTEYSIVFRLAEQHLIRAEAALELGNLEQAKDDINLIRNRAGLDDTTAKTKEALQKELLQQRRFEFFTEHGHRWFDLKRLNKAEIVLSPIKPGWKNTDTILPIPQQEIILNPNLLPQNPGY